MSLFAVNRGKVLVVVIFLWSGLFCVQKAFAVESRTVGPTVKSQVSKILLSSLGGAILGISTLSFYDKPQEHLSNVAVGGTVGAVLGSIYVTKESLDYEAAATIDSGGHLALLVTPRQTGVCWGFVF